MILKLLLYKLIKGKIPFGIRRDIVKSIPLGVYCYTPIGYDKEKFIYHIKCCKYYKHKDGLYGKCKLYGSEVTDQCKNCNINFDYADIDIQ